MRTLEKAVSPLLVAALTLVVARARAQEAPPPAQPAPAPPPAAAPMQPAAAGPPAPMQPAQPAPMQPMQPAPGEPAPMAGPAPAAAWQPAAAPKPAMGGAYTHDGFYLRLGIGVGSASFTVKEPSTDVDVTGIGPSLEIALGGTVAPGLVLGGGIYGTSLASPEYKAQGVTSTGGAATVSMIGPFLDYYFNPTGGFHLQAAAGYTALNALKADSDPYPSEDSSGGGFGLVAGAGYEAFVGEEWSVGGLARIQYMSGSVEGADSGNERDVSGTVVSLLFTATLH
ncbi:MAG: outer membrane beta-barrel protein [Polyangiaceae bacterium]